ncbi:FMN-binding negative transcriptional regulator [Agarilytica rhodophyticola]|uniref:FMN-binding negative transcriptional regulator n=1 Tax=Agarilytica rhodophyticola TaxID=1737490 RepID=UPI000B342EFD|nr:FMN-binding negative transcriptional regulator [Agarilytica rhodophyticola]
MHIPKKFRQQDMDLLKGVIREYPFATLITHSEHGLNANHIPMLLSETSGGKDALHGHIARANPLWQEVPDQAEALVVFNGPHCYISPNHYPTKHETGKAVPTWNYIAVHVKGVISFVKEREWIHSMIDSLSREHERSEKQPWSVSDAPLDYIQKMLPAVVGIEISITSISGQWKLSQNQPEQNQTGVIKGLSAKESEQFQSMARLIQKYTVNEC